MKVSTQFNCVILLVVGLLSYGVAGQLERVGEEGTWVNCSKGCPGAHRASVKVKTPLTTEIPNCKVRLEWRRRDIYPERKDIQVYFRGNQLQVNRSVKTIHNDFGVIHFAAMYGSGTYDIYYLPYQVNGGSYNRKDSYQPLRKSTWHPTKLSDGLCEVDERKVRYEAKTEFDLFTEMEVAATVKEFQAIVAHVPKHAVRNTPALLFPTPREHVIRSFERLPRMWAKTPIPDAQFSHVGINGTAMRDEYWVTQIGIYALPGWLVSGVHVDTSSGLTLRSVSSVLSLVRTLEVTSFSTQGIDQLGEPKFSKEEMVPVNVSAKTGPILPLWLGVDVVNGTRAGDVYEGPITVSLQAHNTETNETMVHKVIVNARIQIDPSGAIAEYRGDTDLPRLSRLRWLNSRDYIPGHDEEHIAHGTDHLPIPYPFEPIVYDSNASVIQTLHKNITLGKDGLPEQMTVQVLPYRIRTVLESPITFSVESSNQSSTNRVKGNVSATRGRLLTDGSTGEKFTWQVTGNVPLVDPPVDVQVIGTSDFDGYTAMDIQLTPKKLQRGAQHEAEYKNIALNMQLSSDSCEYMIGMNNSGGYIHDFQWHWRSRDGSPDMLSTFWAGSVHSGIRIRLTGEDKEWEQPRGPFHYKDLSPNSTKVSWDNNGRGGVQFKAADCTFTAYTGKIKLKSGSPTHFKFDFMVTPVKPNALKNGEQVANRWKHYRYYQNEDLSTEPVDEVHGRGAKINIIHQGTRLNPFMMFPFYPQAVKALTQYSAEAKEVDMATKAYYSGGSYSVIAPEIFAFFSLPNNELVVASKVAPDPIPPPVPHYATMSTDDVNFGNYTNSPKAHHWMMEHMPNSNYNADWTSPLFEGMDGGVLTDITVTNRCGVRSRMGNYWLASIKLMADLTGLSGIYFDGIAYSRSQVVRARRSLDDIIATRRSENKEEKTLSWVDHGLIDLHCGNRWGGPPGSASSNGLGESSVVEYINVMSLLDSTMFGEGYLYDDKSATPEWMLISASSLAYGVFNDMLQAGGNVFKGMVYGSVTRPPYQLQNPTNKYCSSSMWHFWDAWDFANNTMLGWWANEKEDGWWNPFKPVACTSNTSVKEFDCQETIKMTAYVKPDRILVAIASWDEVDLNITVSVDWEFLKTHHHVTFEARDVIYIEKPSIESTQPSGETRFKGNRFTVPAGHGLLLAFKPTLGSC